jgi:hypothetical protein
LYSVVAELQQKAIEIQIPEFELPGITEQSLAVFWVLLSLLYVLNQGHVVGLLGHHKTKEPVRLCGGEGCQEQTFTLNA